MSVDNQKLLRCFLGEIWPPMLVTPGVDFTGATVMLKVNCWIQLHIYMELHELIWKSRVAATVALCRSAMVLKLAIASQVLTPSVR